MGGGSPRSEILVVLWFSNGLQDNHSTAHLQGLLKLLFFPGPGKGREKLLLTCLARPRCRSLFNPRVPRLLLHQVDTG
jgi:hypothetical protein